MDKHAPLLKTKYCVPAQRANQVLRPRLIARMEESLRPPGRLTLISARAGSGKTTLVSEWLHQQGRPFSWLSLDPNDNDAWRFFNYLVEALQQVKIPVQDARAGDWEQPALPPVEIPMTELINSITASSLSFILVLDDYHLIQNDWIHNAIGFLIEHQPAEMHLVLTSRVDPPLPLAQLRARGVLICDARPDDLTAAVVGSYLAIKRRGLL